MFELRCVLSNNTVSAVPVQSCQRVTILRLVSLHKFLSHSLLLVVLVCRPALAVEQLNVAYFLEWATPNLIAKSEKLYDDALGVPVNWIAFESGIQMTEAMLAGDIDISYSQGLVPFMTAINAGAPLLMVGVAVEYPANPCIVADEKGIDASNASELEGHTVALPLSTMADYSYRMQMETLAVDTSQISIVDQVPADAAISLADGRVSMACLWGGDSVKKTRQHGKPLMDEQALIDAGIISFDVISVTQQFASSNPEIVEIFMSVTDAVNKDYARNKGKQLGVVASEAGMDLETARNQMTGMIFPTVEDQLIIYFNKSGLADTTIDMVGQVFSTLERPSRQSYSAVIDTRFLK